MGFSEKKTHQVKQTILTLVPGVVLDNQQTQSPSSSAAQHAGAKWIFAGSLEEIGYSDNSKSAKRRQSQGSHAGIVCPPHNFQLTAANGPAAVNSFSG